MPDGSVQIAIEIIMIIQQFWYILYGTTILEGNASLDVALNVINVICSSSIYVCDENIIIKTMEFRLSSNYWWYRIRNEECAVIIHSFLTTKTMIMSILCKSRVVLKENEWCRSVPFMCIWHDIIKKTHKNLL